LFDLPYFLSKTKRFLLAASVRKRFDLLLTDYLLNHKFTVNGLFAEFGSGLVGQLRRMAQVY